MINIEPTCLGLVSFPDPLRVGLGTRLAWALVWRSPRLPGFTLGSRIQLVLCFDFVLLTPSLSTGPLSVPSSNSYPVIIDISFPDGNVTRSGRISFVLGVWFPLDSYQCISAGNR